MRTTFFAIVCAGRTGSQMLVTMLDGHPDIECRGELFGPAREFETSGLSRARFLDEAAYATNAPIRGFKMPFDWQIRHTPLIELLVERGYRVLRLHRRNALEHYLSAELAAANGDWGSAHEHVVQRVRIDPWAFMSFVGIQYCANVVMDAWCEPLPSLHVAFEDLFGDETQRRILAFLGAEERALTASTVRARSRPTHEAIENYDDLVRFFAPGPYAGWFPPVTAR